MVARILKELVFGRYIRLENRRIVVLKMLPVNFKFFQTVALKVESGPRARSQRTANTRRIPKLCKSTRPRRNAANWPLAAKAPRWKPRRARPPPRQRPPRARTWRQRWRNRALPDIDLKRVEEVRAALARGEVRFDAARLADLVEQYHRSR